MDAIVPAYEGLFGDAFRVMGTDAEVRLGRSTLRFTTTHVPAKIRIGVSDLGVTRECLCKNRVSYDDAGRCAHPDG